VGEEKVEGARRLYPTRMDHSALGAGGVSCSASVVDIVGMEWDGMQYRWYHETTWRLSDCGESTVHAVLACWNSRVPSLCLLQLLYS
jgi:hypothetical protein